MALTDKLKGFSNNVQQTTKNATYGLGHILLRLASGFLIGLVLALICQEIFGLGLFMLIFLNVLFMAFAGSERPTTGFVTKEITTSEPACPDIPCCTTGSCIDLTARYFVALTQQQLLVGLSISSSSRCCQLYTPPSSPPRTIPSPTLAYSTSHRR